MRPPEARGEPRAAVLAPPAAVLALALLAAAAVVALAPPMRAAARPEFLAAPGVRLAVGTVETQVFLAETWVVTVARALAAEVEGEERTKSLRDLFVPGEVAEAVEAIWATRVTPEILGLQHLPLLTTRFL